MKLFLALITSAVIVAVLIFAWRDFDEAKKARSRLSALAAEHAKRDAEIASTQVRVENASRDETKLGAAVRGAEAGQGKSVTPSAVSSTGNSQTSPGRPDVSALLQNNPALRESFKRAYRANLALRFRPFYDASKLSPDQTQKFEELLTEAEQDRMDLESVANAQGLKGNDPELIKMRKEVGDKLQASQKEVLGDEGYQQLQAYQRTEPLLSIVNGMAALVAHTSDPITMAQVEKIVGVMAASSTPYQNGGRANPLSVDWTAALPKVQAVLSPSQYDSFKAHANGAQVAGMLQQYSQQQKATAK